MKAYRYYDLILGAYVCVVLCANLIGAARVWHHRFGPDASQTF